MGHLQAQAVVTITAHLWAGQLFQQRAALQLWALQEQQAAEGAQRAGGAAQLLQRQQLLAHRCLQLSKVLREGLQVGVGGAGTVV